MSYDPVDVLGGTAGVFLRRVPLFLLAVWCGSICGAGALAAGALAEGTRSIGFMLDALIWAPTFLVSGWGMWNLFILLIAFVYFVRADGEIHVPWMWFAGVESLIVMLGHGPERSDGWLVLCVSWSAWVFFLGVAATGVWFLRQWQINRWALHLARVNAESMVRKAAQESRQREPEYTVPPVAAAVVEVRRLTKDS